MSGRVIPRRGAVEPIGIEPIACAGRLDRLACAGQVRRDELLYLVRETKGTLDLDYMRPDEKHKNAYSIRHFTDTLKVNYCVVKSSGQLPDQGA